MWQQAESKTYQIIKTLDQNPNKKLNHNFWLKSTFIFEGSIVVCPKDLGCPKHVAYTVGPSLMRIVLVLLKMAIKRP